jgi:hypothetical protein
MNLCHIAVLEPSRMTREKEKPGGHTKPINAQVSFVPRNSAGPQKYSLAWMFAECPLIDVELKCCKDDNSSEWVATELWW